MDPNNPNYKPPKRKRTLIEYTGDEVGKNYSVFWEEMQRVKRLMDLNKKYFWEIRVYKDHIVGQDHSGIVKEVIITDLNGDNNITTDDIKNALLYELNKEFGDTYNVRITIRKEDNEIYAIINILDANVLIYNDEITIAKILPDGTYKIYLPYTALAKLLEDKYNIIIT